MHRLSRRNAIPRLETNCLRENSLGLTSPFPDICYAPILCLLHSRCDNYFATCPFTLLAAQRTLKSHFLARKQLQYTVGQVLNQSTTNKYLHSQHVNLTSFVKPEIVHRVLPRPYCLYFTELLSWLFPQALRAVQKMLHYRTP